MTDSTNDLVTVPGETDASAVITPEVAKVILERHSDLLAPHTKAALETAAAADTELTLFKPCIHGELASQCNTCENSRHENFNRLTKNVPIGILDLLTEDEFSDFVTAAENGWEFDMYCILRDVALDNDIDISHVDKWVGQSEIVAAYLRADSGYDDDGAPVDVDSWLYDEKLWPSSTTTSTTTPGSKLADAWTKCRHYQAPIEFPSGVILYGSSQHSNRQDDPIPDLGIYLSGSWTPDTIAYHVGCPDWGIPKPSMEQVMWMGREGLKDARSGRRVEIGCVGGHGRTGLMMALMLLLDEYDNDRTMTGKDAVQYVREKYCKEAIESRDQEWYVDCLEAELAGVEWPERPPVPTYTSSSTTLSTFTQIPEPCAECGHQYRHNNKKPCWVWTAREGKPSGTCGCTKDHPEGWDVVLSTPESRNNKVYMADEDGELREICGHSPAKDTHVTCERAPHPNGIHFVYSLDGKPLRKWYDYSDHAQWVKQNGQSIPEGD